MPINPRRKRRSGPPTPWSQLKKRYRGTAARQSLKRKGLWYSTPRRSRAAWKDIEASFDNPALKPVRKSTGWLNGPAGTNTQIKFKKNPGGRTEVYIRRKARPAATAIKKNRTYRFRRAGKVGGRQRPSRPLGPPPPGTRWTSSADENAKWLRKHPEYKNPMSKRKTSTRKRR